MPAFPRVVRAISRSSILGWKRKATGGLGTESLSCGRQGPLQWLRRWTLNQLGIRHAVWLMALWWMMVWPLPAGAQTFIPAGPITSPIDIPANNTFVVGTDSTRIPNFNNSLSSTITIDDPNTSFLVKAGSGTFTIDGGTITGPGQFIAVGGVVAQTAARLTPIPFSPWGAAPPILQAPSTSAAARSCSAKPPSAPPCMSVTSAAPERSTRPAALS